MIKKTLNTEADYDQAFEALHKLAIRPEGSLTPKQQDRLEHLAELIAVYDAKKPARDLSRQRGIKMLKILMAGAGMKASNLGRLLGDRGLGSRILNGKRKLDLRHVKVLSDHFHVSPDVFMPTK
ncbi:MAG: hypothetical protein NTX50_12965 [Candidatus Sumerlaeota bacterium]|nr:hypothetical protein [Candidatus Sumerlaeota bacterium]